MIDEIDRKILMILQENARTSNADIARAVSMYFQPAVWLPPRNTVLAKDSTGKLATNVATTRQHRKNAGTIAVFSLHDPPVRADKLFASAR